MTGVRRLGAVCVAVAVAAGSCSGHRPPRVAAVPSDVCTLISVPALGKVLGGTAHQVGPGTTTGPVGITGTVVRGCTWTGSGSGRAGTARVIGLKVITGTGVGRDFAALAQHAVGGPVAQSVGGVGAPALWVAGSQLVALDGPVRIEVSAVVASASSPQAGGSLPELPDQRTAQQVAKLTVTALSKRGT